MEGEGIERTRKGTEGKRLRKKRKLEGRKGPHTFQCPVALPAH